MKYFYIDNNKYKLVKNNISIIDFCKNLGINIPYFCYHKKLPLAGNCRMCLIELKNSLKPIVSCTMTLLNNMYLYTNSPLVKKSRENILEFLLLNHPLDCPICDQGGECDLQDQSLTYGNIKNRFYSFKRTVINKNIGPIVKMVMTRCIHCTRCVRFATIIAGINSLGIFNRGMRSEIGTYVKKTFLSELSGNLIDICPVGALTSKQYPFINRSWEIKKFNSFDYSDGFGLQILVYSKNNNVIKIQPNVSNIENDWISDKTRFSFDGMFSIQRHLNIFFSNSEKIKNSLIFIIHKISLIIYFKDHLYQHLLKKELYKIYMILGNNVSMNLLHVLYLLQQNFIFLRIKTLENTKNFKDIEEFFLVNSLNPKNKINLSEMCLLYNLNTRYEGYSLNIKLRQSYIKNNLKIFCINSIFNLTIPSFYLGSSNFTLQNISEGNHILCQELLLSNYPFFVSNFETLNSVSLCNFIDYYSIFIKYYNKLKSKKYQCFNILSTTLGLTGLNMLAYNFKNFSIQDLNNFNILYLVNIKYNYLNKQFAKHLELKLLTNNFKLRQIIIEQNFLFNSELNSLKIYSKNFFESENNIYCNTEGMYKSSIKIVNSQISNSKNNTFILKTLNATLKKIKLMSYKYYFNYDSFKSIFNSHIIFNLLNLPSNFITLLKFNYEKKKNSFFFF